ncbi:MAG: glycosyltransferase family 2 protein [Candidatus Aenigmarchaeota archaeon]|nr:glycosyltransferase family 2 protein [Candidatus Aenigmarchaeota archaeon]
MVTVVLIPAYNEEATIRDIIIRLKKIDYLVPLVIDDYSSDKTVEISKKEGSIVIKHKKNKGKGEALITGFNFILKKLKKAEYVAILDADLQYMPEDIPKLIKPLKNKNADYVTGYRNWMKIPFRHTLGNFIWRTCFNLLFGTNFKDTNCGFIAMNRNSMKILIKGGYGGYIIENVMLVEALNNNLKIKQIPVDVYYYEKRDIITGSRYVLGNLIFIIESGIRHRFGIELKLYEKIEKTKLIFTKGN